MIIILCFTFFIIISDDTFGYNCHSFLSLFRKYRISYKTHYCIVKCIKTVHVHIKSLISDMGKSFYHLCFNISFDAHIKTICLPTNNQASIIWLSIWYLKVFYENCYYVICLIGLRAMYDTDSSNINENGTNFNGNFISLTFYEQFYIVFLSPHSILNSSITISHNTL